MNSQMIVWCVIAGVLLCAFIYRSIESLYVRNYHRKSHKAARHAVEFGKEKEMFYIPGDYDDEEEIGN